MHICYLTCLLTIRTAFSAPSRPPLDLSFDDLKPRLRANPDGKFKLSIFSDLHFGENEDSFGIPQDINSTLLMSYVLDVEQPDFTILNGDLITGENTFASNSTAYVDRIVAPLVQREIPWSSTYGNHDSKYNLTREGILAAEQRHPRSYTRHGPPGTDGVSNYFLPLWPAISTPRETPLAVLYFFDSRGGSQGQPDNTDNIPNYVSARTAAWFSATHAAVQATWGAVPSLAFVHIPFKAYADLQAQAAVSGPRYPGLNADVPLAQQGYVGTGVESEPFMDALRNAVGLHSVYTGHDHGDSWCGRWTGETPFLCFCKHAGFGGYGTWNRGVRQVLLEFGGSGMQVETWVRMQQGAVVTRVTLNETYGMDTYPTADGGYHPY